MALGGSTEAVNNRRVKMMDEMIGSPRRILDAEEFAVLAARYGDLSAPPLHPFDALPLGRAVIATLESEGETGYDLAAFGGDPLSPFQLAMASVMFFSDDGEEFSEEGEAFLAALAEAIEQGIELITDDPLDPWTPEGEAFLAVKQDEWRAAHPRETIDMIEVPLEKALGALGIEVVYIDMDDDASVLDDVLGPLPDDERGDPNFATELRD
jgi:hypothetical protein